MDSVDSTEKEKDIMVEHTHPEVLLIEEQSNEEEIIKEIEFEEEEEEVAFNNSWIGPDILPFFAENCSFNPKVAHRTPLETVGEVTFEQIGGTSTDAIDEAWHD